MKEFKTKDVLKAYRVLGAAKYSKLEDADKILVWKIARTMKPIADKFEEDMQSAQEALKPEGYDDDLLRAQSYERALKNPNLVEEQKMGPAEYDEFIVKMRKYQKTVDKALKENAEKMVPMPFVKISEEAFCKLMQSNDWTLDQVTEVDMIAETK